MCQFLPLAVSEMCVCVGGCVRMSAFAYPQIYLHMEISNGMDFGHVILRW